MSRLAKEDILDLSISERIQPVKDTWGSMVELPETAFLTYDQKKEPDKRLDAYRLNPNEGSPWEQVRRRIQKRA